MPSNLVSVFGHAIFLSFLALFPMVNPIGTALIVEPFLGGLAPEARREAVRTIASYALVICLGTLVFGGLFFKVFGISVPAVQVAGGLVISHMAWNVLHAKTDEDESKKVLAGSDIASVSRMLFFPLAFPTTTGAGTISVILTLSANAYSEHVWSHLMNLLAIAAASVLMCLLVFVCYGYSHVLIGRLSRGAQLAINRFSGFLTFCVGVQILANGLLAFVHTYRH